MNMDEKDKDGWNSIQWIKFEMNDKSNKVGLDNSSKSLKGILKQ